MWGWVVPARFCGFSRSGRRRPTFLRERPADLPCKQGAAYTDTPGRWRAVMKRPWSHAVLKPLAEQLFVQNYAALVHGYQLSDDEAALSCFRAAGAFFDTAKTLEDAI